MHTPSSAQPIRTALYSTVALLLFSTAVFAQNIPVTGVADAGNPGSGTSNSLFVSNDHGFFVGSSFTFSDNSIGFAACRTTGNSCRPGSIQSLGATNSDFDMHPTWAGITYDTGCVTCQASFSFSFNGSYVLPPLAPAATVTAPFTFSATFSPDNIVTLHLSGAGTATITMHQAAVLGFTDQWIVDRIAYWFDSQLPQPWLAADAGATGLYGSTTFDAPSGTWNVAGAGADVWGSADAFRYVFPYPAGANEIVARVDSEENTSQFAKAGIMFRAVAPTSGGISSGDPHVLLDVVPGGGIEFMTRSQARGDTTFLATTSVTFPVWLKLSLGQGVTASVSEDGTSWQTVGVTSSPFSSAPLAGLIVTSHDTQALNHAVFSHVSATTQAPSALPSPWIDTDIGAVGQAGSASFDANLNQFTVIGAGADIWGTADSFNYLYSPLAGDGTVAAVVRGEQNTSQFAKAGLVMRSTTDPASTSVIVDCLPDGTIEFMARTSPGGQTTFIASNADESFPRTLFLKRQGATITASVQNSTGNVTLGSVMVPDFASGGVLAGLAVTSHDTSVTNTATFSNAIVSAAPSSLPSGWSSQDIGATGLAGSSSYSNATQAFTIQGAGADIWGTVDAFQFAYQPANTGEPIQARVVSDDATNQFAKAGVMYRGGLTPDAAFVILDMVPDGHIEFMMRQSEGAPVQFIASANAGFGAMLNLTPTGSTIAASYSTDGGATWTTIGSASPQFSIPSVLGLIVCSHDPGVLSTAVFDSVRTDQRH